MSLATDIATKLRDYIVDGVPSSGAYKVLKSDLRDILTEALTAQRVTAVNLQLYVNSSTGNDTTGTGAIGAPFATIDKARQVLFAQYDCGGSYPKLICTGTFTESVQWGGMPTGGPVSFIQGSAPGAFVWKPGGDNYCLLVADMAVLEITNCKFDGTGTTGAYGVFLHQQCIIDFNASCEFGSFPSGTHVGHDHGNSVVNFNASYKISGSAANHIQLSTGGTLTTGGAITVTITGTPTLGVFVALTGLASGVIGPSTTYSGSVSGGQKYALDGNAVLYLNSNTLPGGTAGAVTNGGRAI
jgi:hypothetical protein